MAKRGSNIYKRKDGRYEGRINIGRDERGKIKYKYVYGHTLSEVKEKMADSYGSGEWDNRKCKLTIKDISEQWLNEKQLTVKKSSYNSYRNLIRNHIQPYFGEIKYTVLNKQMINSYISKLLNSGRKDKKGGLSAKTVRDILVVLKAVCKYAHNEYHLSNPAENVKPPRIEKSIEEIPVLNREERRKLEHYLINNPTLTNVGILLCLYSGIRIGELCALQWNDINVSKGKISITKTVQRISLGNGTTKVVVGTPKSYTSVRDVPLPTFVCEILKECKGTASSYLLSNNGTPVEPRTIQNRFKAVLRDCSLRNIKFHGLRHTYATMCIENGFDAKTLSELLGHADVNITLNRYVHSSDDMKKHYVDKLRPTA